MSISKLFVIVVLPIVGFTGLSSPRREKPPLEVPLGAVPQPEEKANPDPRMPYFRVCADECGDCARTCDLCAEHCATMIAEAEEGAPADTPHLPGLRGPR